ncbi:MAG: hypothetical protein P8Y44_13590 [Acidobacteriota bacterium]
MSTSKPEKSKRPWRFLLHNIHIEGSESIGVLGYALSGDGSIDADLALELNGGPLTLERTRIDWEGAELTVKGQTAAHDMTLDLEVSLAPFVPKRVRGAEVLGSLSGRIDIQGQTQGAGVANQLLSRFKSFAVGSSGGQMDGKLLVEKGILGPGSRFELNTEEGWIELVDLRVETALEVDVAVEAETGTRLSLAVDNVALSTKGDTDPILEGARLSLVAMSQGIDFSHGPSELGDSFDTVEVDLSDAHVSDVARFPIPRFKGFSLLRGDMTVASHFSTSPESAAGKVEVTGRGIDALMDEIDLTGDLEIDLNLTSTDPQLRAYDLEQSEIKIDNVTMTQGDKKVKAKDEDWYAHITLVDGLFEVTQPRKMHADVKIEARDTRPIIAVFAQDKSVMKFFKGMLNFKDLLATTQIGLAGGATEIRNLDIDSEGLKVKSNLRIEPGPENSGSTGILWMKFHGINVGLDLRGDKTKVHLRKPLQWYEEQLAAWGPTEVETVAAQSR